MVIGETIQRRTLDRGPLAASKLRQRYPDRIRRRLGGLGCA